MQTEIIDAVKRRDAARVGELLAEDPSLALTPTDDGSLLLTAVFYGARDAAALIRAHKPELNLSEAIALGETDRVRDLLAAEPGLASAYDSTGGTPLHLAAFMGRQDAVELLVVHGADVNAFRQHASGPIPRNAALHAALAGGKHDVARYLVAHGADVNAVDSEGFTALHHAAFGGNADMVAFLLGRGARGDGRNKAGQTPAEVALGRGHGAVAELLKEH
jgi:ankyrin repeat protein